MLANRDKRIMQFIRRQAIDVEKVSNARVAAGIAIKGQLISTGKNSRRTHPFQKQFSKNDHAIFFHAETCAISNSLNHIHKDDLRRATLFIHRVKIPLRYSTEWVDGLAKPCNGCMAAVAAFNIRRVVYSTDVNHKYVILERNSKWSCDEIGV